MFESNRWVGYVFLLRVVREFERGDVEDSWEAIIRKGLWMLWICYCYSRKLESGVFSTRFLSSTNP